MNDVSTWEWIAPAVGVLIALALPVAIAAMAETIASRLVVADLESHERHLDQPLMPRKDETRQRLRVEETWERIEGYRRVRNICLIIALAVVEVNVVSVLILLFALSSPFEVTLLVIAVVAFAYAVLRARRKPQRPEWVTIPDYYRNLLKGPAA